MTTATTDGTAASDLLLIKARLDERASTTMTTTTTVHTGDDHLYVSQSPGPAPAPCRLQGTRL